jgi:hypothetical protein
VLAGMEQQVRQMASKDFLVRECTLSARSGLLPIHENESGAHQQATAPAVVNFKALRPISYVCGCPRGLQGRNKPRASGNPACRSTVGTAPRNGQPRGRIYVPRVRQPLGSHGLQRPASLVRPLCKC